MEFGSILTNPILIVILASFHLAFAGCLFVLAHRLGFEDAWVAWLPLVNLFLLLSLAAAPGWWFLLALLPGINLAVFTYVFMVIAEKRGRPARMGLLALSPPTALVLTGMLAFGPLQARGGRHAENVAVFKA